MPWSEKREASRTQHAFHSGRTTWYNHNFETMHARKQEMENANMFNAAQHASI